MTRPPLTVAGVTLPCVRDDDRLTLWVAVIATTPRSRLIVLDDSPGGGMWSGGIVIDGLRTIWTDSRPSPEAAAEELAALLSDLRAALAGVPGGGA